MAEVFEVPVGDTWVNVNAVSTIASGTAMELTNKGNNDLFLTESTTIPLEDNVGKIMTSIGDYYAVANILAGSDTIWARCLSVRGTTITAQEIVTS